MFSFPNGSSSPPSTPVSRPSKSGSFFDVSHPSTTPAGPPPFSLTNKSTTPSGPPPSSRFNSSNAFGSSFPSRTPPRPRRSDFRSSPLKLASSRRNRVTADAMDEDHDMDIGDDFQRSPSRGKSGRAPLEKIVDSIEGISLPAVAKSISSRPAALLESGDIILGTKRIIESIYSEDDAMEDDKFDQEEVALANAIDHLLRLWKSPDDTAGEPLTIGPGEDASPMAKCRFLASLLLSFHHPGYRSSSTGPIRSSRRPSRKAIPEILLDWLDEYHNPYPNDYVDVMSNKNSPAADERFWNAVLSLSMRGRLKEVCNLLKEADFSHAWSALEDGENTPGYHGKQLGNVQRVINRAVAVLETCPAGQAGDWDVKGTDWSIYRKRVQHARSDLVTMAEGIIDQDPQFESGFFGLSNNSGMGDSSMSRMSQRAQSKLPWSIYESLKQLYSQHLGMTDEILAVAADWVEGTIGLTVWWDGNNSPRRRSSDKPQHSREVDVRPVAAYQRKLMTSLRQIGATSDEAELQVNTLDPVEVGLGCVFEGDVEGVVRIMKGWSQVVCTAVAELATFGSWIGDSASAAIIRNFNESDLMVLSVSGQDVRGTSGFDLDKELVSYADLLSQEKVIKTSLAPKEEFEGWEVALQTLGRVQDEVLANSKIGSILEGLDLSPRRSESALMLCKELNVPALGRRVAERYADHLSTSSNKYGEALYYYARAHHVTKVKEVLNVLISTSLVQSSAHPATAALDTILASMTDHSSRIFTELRNSDHEAADILISQLAGYATLRRFYHLRDADILASPAHKSEMRPQARKHEAASALVSLIMSAADSIHGGLFDSSIDSVVPVDGLLCLFGEALVFVNQPARMLSTPQVFALLKAIEDISTVSPSVFEQAKACFVAAVAASLGSRASASLGSSTSDLMASSQFSLANGAMSGSKINGSMEGSGVLVRAETNGEQSEVRRAWDWRKGLEETATPQDVLSILRLGLAREVSRAWTS